MSWGKDDVMEWLNDHPLPADFVYNGEKVWPRYKLKKGFGFWLRTSGPYHPALRGLFNLITEILIEHVVKQWPMPTPEELAELITAETRKQPDLPIFDAGAVAESKPNGNPTETQDKPTGTPTGSPSFSQL